MIEWKGGRLGEKKGGEKKGGEKKGGGTELRGERER